MEKIYSSFEQKKLLTLFCSSIFFFLFLEASIANAQLIVTTPVVASDVVSKLLGCNSVASNITLSSCGTAVGYFNGVNTNLGIDSGILFSSGNANFAVGPNNSCCQGTDNGCAGNAALTALCGQPTFNAAILDFDVVLNVDTLRFNYVFGSDEYSEWVGTSYNDVFALWLSG
ncbi:MAG: choice-of-anchor L domain-containing protein, partial [Chitinophagales bacterium]|nr:choice-of-anchor L domain-containing protein [Chitinophagales bacterium]